MGQATNGFGVYGEYGTLREVVVGIAEDLTYPTFNPQLVHHNAELRAAMEGTRGKPLPVKQVFPARFESTQEQLDNLASVYVTHGVEVRRPRPFTELKVSLLFYQPTDSSFPANPAAVAFAVAMGVWLWNRKVGTVLLGVATVFAFSRVYAGVFYPLDVLGGAFIGAGVSLLVAWLLRLIEPLPTLVLRLARATYLA